MNDTPFSYDEAFSRNEGWVTKEEQKLLRGKRIAIAGLGGVGGSHLLTLARLGIGAFNISDMDVFEGANMNRQAGASQSTIGKEKIEVLSEMARDINPDLEIGMFPEGINDENIYDFLHGCDLYVDGLDFFALDIRRKVFVACAEMKIPAVTVAPLGMSAALMVFMPKGLTFEQYFGFEGYSREDQQIRFLVGLAPALLHRKYLVDPSVVDFKNKKVPSTGMACELCAGIAGTEALKILLGRGKTVSAPCGTQFDAYRHTFVSTGRWGILSKLWREISFRFARYVLNKK